MYSKILIPLDLAHESSWQKALPEAVQLARAHGAELHLMTVVLDYGMAVVGGYFPPDFKSKALAKAEEDLRQLAAQNVADDVSHKIHIAHGRVYEKIIAIAQEIGADLIVMAAHHPDLKEYLVGSNAERVMRHCHCSFFLVRDGTQD